MQPERIRFEGRGPSQCVLRAAASNDGGWVGMSACRWLCGKT